MNKKNIATKNKELKEEISKKKAQYYQENRLDIAIKGHEYYAKNKENILKKEHPKGT